MKKRLHSMLILAGVLLATHAVVAADKQTDSEKSEDRFVRLRRDDDKKPLALETAVVRYKRVDDQEREVLVDLIGAIHIGDKAYFAELNRRFRQYDAVLYELVAPEEANVPRPGQSPGSAIGGMQMGMKAMLELAFQLDEIDYRAKNLVHADMSPEEFSRTMKERNESFTGMFFRVLGRSFGEQAKDPFGSGDIRLLAAMFAPDRAHQLKLIMAEQFADLESQMDMFDGPDGSTIVTERNKKALDVLQRELAAGKQRLAIFYGAGHLPDFHKRLQEQFGLKHVETEWLPAWSLVKAGD
ncbi:MAG: hypothetical protein KJ000_06405 [Pirellulaceae bacterium]|nr:hypothetical protein [Pirellulaceae bacterium]